MLKFMFKYNSASCNSDQAPLSPLVRYECMAREACGGGWEGHPSIDKFKLNWNFKLFLDHQLNPKIFE